MEGCARHLTDIEDAFSEYALEFDPDAFARCEARHIWDQLAHMRQLADACMTLLARSVDEARTWQREGFRSAAEQMAAKAGTSVTAAKSMLQTSERVAEQPKTAQAMRSGELSGAKAELVAGAIEVAPEQADRLLGLAKNAPLARVREESVRIKAAVDGDERYARIRRERRADSSTDGEGAWTFRARGPVDDGATFLSVFEPIREELFKQAHREGRQEPVEAYAFDALIELARRASGEGSETKPSSAPQRLGLVRVDHAALVRGQVEGDEICEIAGLGPIPARVARDLLGEAVVKLVITKGVDVANVTHLGRGPTVARKMALWWANPQCTTLDCTRVQRIQFDHREEWNKTHHTRLDEGDGLCEHCHDLKTYSGWALVEGTGKRPMVPSDDPRHPKNKPKQQ